jgi:hypothetical protein
MPSLAQPLDLGTLTGDGTAFGLRKAMQIINCGPSRGDLPAPQTPMPGLGWCNVLSWDAKADGSADDTAAIQGAHDAAASAGGDVYFPPGIYKTTRTLDLTGANVRFVGVGRASIIRPATSAFNVITLGPNAHGAGVIDLQLQGAATTGTPQGQWGIFTNSQAAPNDVTIQRCLFSGIDAATGLVNAVLLDGLGVNGVGVRWKLLQNHVERLWGTASGSGYGFLLSRAWSAVVLGNTFLGTAGRGRHAVYGPLLRTCHIGENTIDLFNDAAIILGDYDITDTLPGAERNDIIGNVIRGGGYDSPGVSGIGLYGQVKYTNIVGNVIDGFKGRASIEVSRAGTLGTPQDNCLIANSISNGDQFGINVQGAIGTAIQSNSIQDISLLNTLTYAAIKVQQDNSATAPDRTQIIGNVARGPTQRCGVSIDVTAPTPTKTVITGNYFPDYYLSPIEVNGVTDVLISNNNYGNDPVSADNGDANVTLTNMVSSPTQMFQTTLTANRTVTLSTTHVHKGAKFRIVRTGLGAFTLDVGGLKTISAGTAAFVEVEHTGAAWILTGYGLL